MDCVSTAQSAIGLRPRRLKGLRRPTKDVPGIGLVELVRDERCHCWQIQKQIVATRYTLIDEVVVGTESEADSLAYWEQLWSLERLVRTRLATALWKKSPTSANLYGVVQFIDEWLVPYRISRSCPGYLIQYDCTDGPDGSLIGNILVNAFIEPSGLLSRIDTYTAEQSGLLELELRNAYRQRIVPRGCGFVCDSIADRLICSGYVRPCEEYWKLLSDSIAQTTALLQTAESSHRAFLTSARTMLQLVQSNAVSRLKT